MPKGKLVGFNALADLNFPLRKDRMFPKYLGSIPFYN